MSDRINALLEAERRGILPDNMKAALAEARKRGLVGGGQGTPANAEGGTSVRKTNTAGTLAASAAQGMANAIVDLPIKAYNAVNAINPMTGDEGRIDPSKNPLRPSTHIGEFEAQTPEERVAGAVGELAGETATLTAGAIGLAPKLAAKSQAARNAIKARGGIGAMVKLTADDVLNLLRNKPGRVLAAETGLSGLAGGGMQAAEEAGAGPVGQMAAGIGAAMAPTAIMNGPTATVARMGAKQIDKYGRRGINAVRPGTVSDDTEAVVSREISRAIDNVLDDGTRAKMAEGERVSRKVGVDTTLAETSRSPALAREQEFINEKLSGRAFDEEIARIQKNNQAIYDYKYSAMPDGPDAVYLVDELDGTIERLQGQIGARLDDVNNEMLRTSPKRSDRFKEGEVLRDRLAEARTAKRAEMDALASEMGINDIDVTDDYIDFASDILAQTASDSRFSKSVVTDNSILGKLKDEVRAYNDALAAGDKAQPPKTTVLDVKRIREGLSDEITGALSGEKPDKDKARRLIAAKESIDGFLDDLGTVNPQYEQFRQRYKAEYIDRFEQGAAFKTKKNNARGGYETRPERVASMFWDEKDLGAVKQFNEIFSGDEQAYRALYNIALDDLSTAAARDGVLDMKKYGRWMEDHRALLNQLPELKTLVLDQGVTQQALLNRQGTLSARQKVVADAQLTKALKKYRSKDKSAQDIVADVFKNARLRDEVLSQVRKDPEMEKAFKRSVWTQAIDAGDPEKIDRFMQAHKDTLVKVLGEQHYADLEDIVQANEIVNFVPLPEAAQANFDGMQKLESFAGMGFPQFMSRQYALQSGRTGKAFVLTEGFSRFLYGRSQEQRNAMMRAALYDKDFAKTFHDVAFKGDKAKIKKLNLFLYQMGMEPFGEEE